MSRRPHRSLHRKANRRNQTASVSMSPHAPNFTQIYLPSVHLYSVPGLSKSSVPIYSTPVASINQNPNSWVEMALQGQALVMSAFIENREPSYSSTYPPGNPNNADAVDAAASDDPSISVVFSNLSQLYGPRPTIPSLANTGINGRGPCAESDKPSWLTKTMPVQVPNNIASSSVIGVPAVGNVGGLPVLWDDSLLELDEIMTTDQEIHVIVKEVSAWACTRVDNIFKRKAKLLSRIQGVPDNNLLVMCRDLLQELGNTLIRHEDKRSNGAADTLAKEGRKKKVPHFFEEWAVPHLFIHKAITINRRNFFC
ncbi:hypothetical protein FXO38_18341 [Capsicum annuum]|nr:hypothetical protein FXO38_18341 [Capsicum annuum]KAF3677110.1 hypothetical protein FXO37_04996 [Capsicum annuum]